MESTPVILLSFANSEKEYLPTLKAEGQALKSALRPLEQRGFIRVEKEESTTSEELVELLAAHKDQLCIFHYGGHAGNDFLELEGKAVQAEGLAKLLGEQENLKLVFLNGCSTKGQVENLLAAGVKAVLATSVSIEDEQARYLATSFYQALANKRSIKRAFEFAKNALNTAFQNSPQVEVYRGIGKSNAIKETKTDMPWGFYVQAEHEEEILRWQLPYYVEQQMDNEITTHIGNQIEVNFDIVMILEGMCKYNPDIYTEMREVRNGEEKLKDSSTFLDLVIENFPWVIGSQLRLLLIFDEPNRARLEQLLSTYYVSSKVLYFILLANLWREINLLKEEEKKQHLATFKKNTFFEEATVLGFDFLKGIGQIYALFQEIKGQLFIPEFERFCDKLDQDDGLKPAHDFLEKLQRSYQKMSDSDIATACFEAEGAVALILKEAAFLANYHMLTVRNIQIENSLHSAETYELELGRLNAVVNTSLRLYDDTDYRRKAAYTNCRSIVIVPNEDDLRTFLNLSPFIIDKNTFLNNSAIDIFLYAFEKEGHFNYLSVNHSIYKAIANEKGTDLIHTNMTDTDFQEGRNVQKKKARKPSQFSARSRLEETKEDVKGKKVFASLERQFEAFKTDFGLL